MKMTGRFLLVCMLMAFTGLRAQNCGEFQPLLAYPGEVPSFLNLITGYDGKLAANVWSDMANKTAVNSPSSAAKKAIFLLHDGKIAEAKKLVAIYEWSETNTGAFDSLSLRENAPGTEAAGLIYLVEGKLDFAVAQLTFALGKAPFGIQCRVKSELLVAQYLSRYGNKAPIHKGFNGGFYGFVQDSMHWEVGAPEATAYLQVLNTVAGLYRMDKAHGAVYLELLGDLLTEEPGKFNSNYISCLSYLRAALLVDENGQKTYERKALFALESPRDREDRFNLYRFTQLKKALKIDIDSSASVLATTNSSADPIKAGFRSEDPGRLAKILTKSKSQIEEKAKRAKRYAGDVDLKVEVKKDSTFNTFALFLILIIVGAAIYIFRRLKKGSAERDA